MGSTTTGLSHGPASIPDRRSQRARLAGLGVVALVLGGCQGAGSTLDPAGPRAEIDADLWWIMFWLGVGVYILVLGLLLYAFLRSNRGRPSEESSILSDNLLIVGGGIVLSLLILPVLWVVTLRAMDTLAEPPTPPDLTVEVIGHRWWYEVHYPEQGIRLTNELHIPSDTTVQFRVSSADVIHSFWVPRLMGKIDMMPGTVNERWLVADEPGTYLVECGEFCGLWHAKMQMEIVAEPPEQFASWLQRQRQSGIEPSLGSRGR